MKHIISIFTIILFFGCVASITAQSKPAKLPVDEKTRQLQKERDELKKLKQQQELELEVYQLRQETARNAKELEKKRAAENAGAGGDDTAASEDAAPVSPANTALTSAATAADISEGRGTRGGKTGGTGVGGGKTGGVGAGGGKTVTAPLSMTVPGVSTGGLNPRPVSTTTTGANDPLAAVTKPAETAQPAAAGGASDSQTAECFIKSTGDPLRQSLCDLTNDIIDRKMHSLGEGISKSNDFSTLQTLISLKLANVGVFEKEIVTFLLAGEKQRTDKQAGSDSKTAGSTSLVVKGAVPRFLSMAQENGAVESSRDGNTITFRANLIGFPEALMSGWYSNYFKDVPALPTSEDITSALFRKDDAFVNTLRKFSVGFSYDISRGSTTPVFTGTRNQLSAVSVRYNVFNGRDPANPIYQEKWNSFLKTQGNNITNVGSDVFKALVELEPGTTSSIRRFINKDLNDWFIKTSQLVAAVKIDATMDNVTAQNKIYKVLADQINVLPVDKIKSDAAVVGALRKINLASISYVSEKNKLLDEIAHGNVFTLEYTNYRDISAPDLSSFRVIYSRGFGAGTDLTFNGSLTMYNKLPAAAALAKLKRLRDFDFALQFDMPLDFFKSEEARRRDLETLTNPFKQNFLGTPLLSFAAKYQRLNSDAFLPDGSIKTGTAGDLFFSQAKVEIPITFNGLTMRVPFSFSYSNRTDLIKEKDVRGSFGLTFDIDPFFKKLRDSILDGFLTP